MDILLEWVDEPATNPTAVIHTFETFLSWFVLVTLEQAYSCLRHWCFANIWKGRVGLGPKKLAVIGPLVQDQCTVVPSHVGCLDIPLSQTLNLKCILHVNINSVLLLLFTSLPMTWLLPGLPSLLSLSWILLTNHQKTFRVYHYRLSSLFFSSSVSSLEWGGLNTGAGKLSASVLLSLVQLLHSLESVKQSNSNCDWQDREQSWRFPVMRKEESRMLYFHEKELHPLNQSEVSPVVSVKLSIFFIKILFLNIHHLRYEIPPKFTS